MSINPTLQALRRGAERVGTLFARSNRPRRSSPARWDRGSRAAAQQNGNAVVLCLWLLAGAVWITTGLVRLEMRSARGELIPLTAQRVRTVAAARPAPSRTVQVAANAVAMPGPARVPRPAAPAARPASPTPQPQAAPAPKPEPARKPAAKPTPRTDQLRKLFDAIRHVESRGKVRAVGDRGRSRGAYQIQRHYWEDACREGGARWSYHRYVWTPWRCEQVMKWYWQRHCPSAYARVARGVGSDYDLEVLARVHNGGPGGHRKSSTLKYFWRFWSAYKAR